MTATISLPIQALAVECAATNQRAAVIQTDTTRCLECEGVETRDTPFVAVLTPVRGRFHWIHAGEFHVAHVARCTAERERER